MDETIRPVRSPEELAAVFDALGAELPEPITHDDRRFADLARRYPADRELMVLAEDVDHRVVGGALAFRGEDGGRHATLRIIAVAAAVRYRGLGRALVDRVEAAAAGLGVETISLGARPEVRGFYLRLGYTGRSGMHKSLPGSAVTRYGDASGRRQALADLRARRAQRLRAADAPAAGDLDPAAASRAH